MNDQFDNSGDNIIVTMNFISGILSFILLINCCFAQMRLLEIILNDLEQPVNQMNTAMGNEDLTDVEKVDLKVYYEVFCPFCRSFDTEVLVPAVRKLASYLQLHTYPYGNAKTTEHDGHYEFTCQHGPKECYGNKLHACVIDILKNITEAVFLNGCMMDNDRVGRGSDDIAANYCAKEMGHDPVPIIECAKSDKGDLLLKEAGDETAKVKDLEGVPWILINGKVFDGEYTDFLPTLCKALKKPPEACKQ